MAGVRRDNTTCPGGTNTGPYPGGGNGVVVSDFGQPASPTGLAPQSDAKIVVVGGSNADVIVARYLSA